MNRTSCRGVLWMTGNLIWSLPLVAGTPLLHLQLDDNPPSEVAVDVSGNGHDGVLQNMDSNTAWTNGQFGGALSFDGLDDQLVIADQPELSFGSSDFTVAFWYWQRELTASFDNVWGVNKLGSVSSEWSLSLGAWNAGGSVTPWFTVWVDGVPYVASAFFYSLWEWHHVVGVRAGDTIVIYVDGQFESSRNLPPGGAMTANGEDIFVAVNGGSGTPTWSNAAFDDIRIYDYALSSEEVGALFEAAAPNSVFGDHFESGDTTQWTTTSP